MASVRVLFVHFLLTCLLSFTYATPTNPPDHYNARRSSILNHRQSDSSFAEEAISRGDALFQAKYQALFSSLSTAAAPIKLSADTKTCKQVGKQAVAACKDSLSAQTNLCIRRAGDASGDCSKKVDALAKTCKKSKTDVCKNIAGSFICNGVKSTFKTLGFKDLGVKFIDGANLAVNLPGSLFCEQVKSAKAACGAQNFLQTLGCSVKEVMKPTCCESSRAGADQLCKNGGSSAAIQKGLLGFQEACKIGTQIAIAALQSYVTGEMVGAVSSLQVVRDLGEGVKVFQDVQTAQKNYKRWGNGLKALMDGDQKRAMELLKDVPVGNLQPGDQGWPDAVKKAAGVGMEAVVTKAAAAAGELQAIKTSIKGIEALQGINNLRSMAEKAKECAKLPAENRASEFEGFQNLASASEVEAALAEYEKSLQKVVSQVAQCAAVVERISRVNA